MLQKRTRVFKSEGILEERISETRLRAYCVGFELKKFRLSALVDLISSAIPDFAFGPNLGPYYSSAEAVSRLREAAISVYSTDNYKRRGEFGEILLHIILRDFFGTFPLVSKVFFKDSSNDNVKGFDAIHVEQKSETLFVGESKLYADGKEGILSLVSDLVSHSKADFLRNEFMFVERKIPHDFPDRDKWSSLIRRETSLDKIFKKMSFVFMCTYKSELFKNHQEASEAYFSDFIQEMNAHKKLFLEKAGENHPFDVTLLLLPVENKDLLVQEMNSRLEFMRNI